MSHKMADEDDASFGGGILRDDRDDSGRSPDTPEMEEFLNRRRAINRRAAQKSRRRQKEHASRVKKLYYDAQSVNTKLTYEKRKLERHRELLLAQWRGHQDGCPRRQWDSAPPSLQSVLIQSPDVVPNVDGDSLQSLSFAGDDYASPAAAASSTLRLDAGGAGFFASFPGAVRLSRSFSCPPPQTVSTALSSKNNSTSDEDDSMIEGLLNVEDIYFASSTAELMGLNLVDDTAEAAMFATEMIPATVAAASTTGGMAGGGIHRQLLDTISESADSSLKHSSMDSVDGSQQDVVEMQSAVGFLQQQSSGTVDTTQRQQSGTGREQSSLRLPSASVDIGGPGRTTTTDAAGGGGVMLMRALNEAISYLPQSVVDESDQDYSLCSAPAAGGEDSSTLSLFDIGGGSGGDSVMSGVAESLAGGSSNTRSTLDRFERRTAAAAGAGVGSGSAAGAHAGNAPDPGSESPFDTNIPIHVQSFSFSK